eukprot:TRINITY_DN1436_c0_g1_i1.p1 TRINITY_DN1436_c0_g1~~TRINITY_DN1436_c0_g1_i1.p1  ORF type:complete len:148 (+),score=20.01 TRINITY_DN1436_c0_g1_i1:420-863(+)
MIWKGMMLVSNSESPVVVVLSGSMRPAFDRGDLLFLYLDDSQELEVGDIVVYKLQFREIPIVHRIIKTHKRRATGELEMLTKGDFNNVDDRGLYTDGQLWLKRDQIIGRCKGFLPYLGMVTVVMNDYPYVKYGLLGFLALVVLTTKE